MIQDGPEVESTRPVTVLGVNGSPRAGGATSRLIRAALLGPAEVPGVRTRSVSLATMRIAGCDRCAACTDAGRCLIDDDMAQLYPLLLQADAIILGSPVYWGSPSALCKAFMERVAGFGLREKRLRLKVGRSDRGGREPQPWPGDNPDRDPRAVPRQRHDPGRHHRAGRRADTRRPPGRNAAPASRGIRPMSRPGRGATIVTTGPAG